MSRDASGNYSLPSGNPVVTGTTITSTWANDTLSDIATEMTDSLNRSGKGPMLAALNIVDGTVSAPGLRFNDEATSGIYRISAGKIGFSVTNSRVLSVEDAKLVVSAQSNAFDVVMEATTDVLTISGSSANNTGANLQLYGSTHATLAGDFKLRNATTDIIHYDLSATNLALASTNIGLTGVITLTGAVTATSTLDVQGAFTSLGIDDNASAERVQVNDTAIYLGTSGSNYQVAMPVTDQSLVFNGGSTTGDRANLVLYGSTHATAAGDFQLRVGATNVIAYDHSATTLTLAATTITMTGTVAMTAGTIDGVTIGGSTPAAGTFTTLTATGAFTSLGIDDNATGERLQISDTQMSFGPNDTSLYVVSRFANTGILNISGGNAGNSGGNLLFYGGAHASGAGDFYLRTDTTNVIAYDHSATTLTLAPTTVNVTNALNVNGAFTSLGIDDNATAERFSIADTGVNFGAAGVSFGVFHASNTDSIILSGGFGTASGANLELYGGAHASQADDFKFKASATTVIAYDHSLTTLTLAPTTVNVTNALNVTGAFTSIGIDDNATGERFQLADEIITLGAAGSSMTIQHVANDQNVFISGGTNTANGANILLRGGAHATLANDFSIRAGNNSVIDYDDSATTITLSPTAGTSSVSFLGSTPRMTLGTAAGANYQVINAVDTFSTTFSGGNATNSGANLILYGGTNATNANDFFIRASSTNVIDYDHGTTTLTFSPATTKASGAFQVLGAFTSLGIDDNATGERMQLADTVMQLGTAGAAYTIARPDNDQQLYISGSNSATSGANLRLSGNTHATAANDFGLFEGSNKVIYYDDSASSITLTPDATTASAVFTANQLLLGQSGVGSVIQSAGSTDEIIINSGGSGGSLTLYDGSRATAANDYALRSGGNDTFYYDSSANKFMLYPTAATLAIEVTNTLFAAGATSGTYTFAQRNADQGLYFAGGTTIAGGSSLLCYGGSHATKANDWEIRASNQAIIYHDYSADTIDFYRTGGTRVMRVSSGGVEVTGSGGGVKIDNLASSDANTLDDYEEGTFTPTLTAASGTGPTYTIQTGEYQKVGNHVYFEARITISSLGTLSGAIRIEGLPFTADNDTSRRGIINIGYATGLGITAGESLTGLMASNAATFDPYTWNATTGTVRTDATEFSADGDMIFSGTYRVA